MGPSSPRTPCSPGCRTTGSSGISLRQESQCRMASARVLTCACATSFSTRACSSASITPGPRSGTGSTITISDARIRTLGYLTPAAYGANLSATRDRLRNPDQLRRSHVAPPAPHGAKPAEALNRLRMNVQWQVKIPTVSSMTPRRADLSDAVQTTETQGESDGRLVAQPQPSPYPLLNCQDAGLAKLPWPEPSGRV
jgi:hypothetical protein